MALHIETPLIASTAISCIASCKVWLKLENCQPSASFKLRGIGALCIESKNAGKKKIISSSGGNAGLAAAYSSKLLNMPCKIFVPGSTSQHTIKLLEAEGAEVQVVGKIWDDANAAAMEEIKANPDYAFVHPFDHPTIWKGNSTVIHEMKQQLGNTVPGCIIASCGGGGLLTGIIQGLDEIGWSHVPVVAMETEGADCLAASVAANKLVTLPDITSIAKSLGSRTVCQQLFDYTKDHNIISHTITDTAAVDACIKFADDHRMLVEPACGASLAVIYSGDIQKLQGTGKLPKDLDNIVVVVCGGNSVSMQTMESYKMLISSTT